MFVAPRAVGHLNSRLAQPRELFFTEVRPSLHYCADPESQRSRPTANISCQADDGREDAGPSKKNRFRSAVLSTVITDPGRFIHPSAAELATSKLRSTHAASEYYYTAAGL